jgi:hypothetical protein
LQARDKLEEVKGKMADIEEGLKTARSEGHSVAKEFEQVDTTLP